MKKKNKLVTLGSEFKKFISRGNVVDMAVGVIMGSAFGAIVTAFTNILLSLCTWPIPGGLSGLVTVLPALTSAQLPPEGFALTMTLEEWTTQASENMALYSSLYTKHGGIYVYNGAAVLDWGVFINAIISFLIIALVLFVIIKIVAYIRNKTAKLKELELEAYYQKHPEERPKPEEPAPAPITELDLLKEIRDELKASKKVENQTEVPNTTEQVQ